jgi:hypothetical protein
MNRTEYLAFVKNVVEQAISEDMCADGTDEFIEDSILKELESFDAILPESTISLLCGLMVLFEIRRREFLAVNPAH